MKLNEWQRLGIIASVIGGLACAWWGLKLRYDPIWAGYSTCLSIAYDQPAYDGCEKLLHLQLADAEGQLWWIVLLTAIVPFALAWIIAYTLVGLVRWVRRGFQT